MPDTHKPVVTNITHYPPIDQQLAANGFPDAQILDSSTVEPLNVIHSRVSAFSDPDKLPIAEAEIGTDIYPPTGENRNQFMPASLNSKADKAFANEICSGSYQVHHDGTIVEIKDDGMSCGGTAKLIPSNTTPVRIVKLAHALPDLPTYATEGSSGVDLRAALLEGSTIVIEPGKTRLIPTGLLVSVPEGMELQIRSRSGLSLKNGIVMANSPGTVDSDYRNELGLLVHNQSTEPFTVTRGLRLAQAVLCPVYKINWVEVANLDETTRKGGYGHTGL